MKKRKGISKKVRFEVFKRDKFKCQYCGASAPEVLLELDHIIPVASGGDDDLMNLVTACKTCNAGKSFRELTDDSVLTKQRNQLEDLQERREQLKLLAQWREDLLKLNSETEKVIEDEINKHIKPFCVSDSYKTNFKKWLRKFTLKEILVAIDNSTYCLVIGKKGFNTEQSIDDFLARISKTANLDKLYLEKPYMKNVFYIRAVAKNIFRFNDNMRLSESKRLLEEKFEEFNELLNEFGKARGEEVKGPERELFNRALSENLKNVTTDQRNYGDWLDSIYHFDVQLYFDTMRERTNG